MAFIVDVSSRNPLRRLPPELREMIYKFALILPVKSEEVSTFYNKKTRSLKSTPRKLCPSPSFLAALRVEPYLYSEALNVFYQINSFPLTGETYHSFMELKTPALALIKNLKIYLSYHFPFFKHGNAI